MFSLRGPTWFILFFWLASMSWLTWTHLRPVGRGNGPPRQDDILPREAVRLKPIRWRISLNGKSLGWAVHHIERLPDGRGIVDSMVRVERLSFDQILQQAFGSLGSLLFRGLDGERSPASRPINLSIENSMRFDRFGQLINFESLVAEDAWGECIRIDGSIRESRLSIKAYVVLGLNRDGPAPEPVFHNVFDLPAGGLIIDSLAPQPQFTNLSVGQRWRFETYHPFFPTHPVRTVNAWVEGRRVLRIDGEDVWTFHITYEPGADDGLSLQQHLGDVYVADDGTVLRQELTWGGVTLRFDRLTDDRLTEPAGQGSTEPSTAAPNDEDQDDLMRGHLTNQGAST